MFALSVHDMNCEGYIDKTSISAYVNDSAPSFTIRTDRTLLNISPAHVYIVNCGHSKKSFKHLQHLFRPIDNKKVCLCSLLIL